MAKYTLSGTVITVDLEDGKPALSVDASKLKPNVQQEGLMMGLKTVIRNCTAGKMEELDKARSAIEARIKLFDEGKWESEATSKASIELEEAERNKVIGDVIVLAKKAKGDVRSPADILKAFNALPEESRKAAVASLQKVIDKRLKDALRQKRLAAKSDVGTALAF